MSASILKGKPIAHQIRERSEKKRRKMSLDLDETIIVKVLDRN